MRHKGLPFTGPVTGPVRLPRVGREPLVLTVRALPFGVGSLAYRWFPDPRPPEEFVLDGRGRHQLDPTTKQPIIRQNFTDPAFCTARDIAFNRRIVYLAWQALAAEPELTFDVASTRRIEDDPAAFCDALVQEFSAAGFSMGDLDAIIGVSNKLANAGEHGVEAVRDSFLSDAERERRSSSPSPPSSPDAPSSTSS